MAFTYEQAQEICEDFEDLIGTELVLQTGKPIKCEIETVCIIPIDEAGRKTFMETYLATFDTEQALAAYNGKEYDVVIIAHSVADKNEVIVQPIEEYISRNGVRYNFPG